MSLYCLPKDYQRRAGHGRPAEERYWTDQRIRLSLRYQNQVYRRAAAAARRMRARTILDLGCGVATKLNRFFPAPLEIHGVDGPEAIAVCRRIHRRGIYHIDDFDQPNGSVQAALPTPDVIVSADVIEHLLQPDHLLAYIRSVAAPHTIIVLSTPERVALAGRAARAPANSEHICEWTAAELRGYVTRAGLEVLEHRMLLPFNFRPDALTTRYVLKRLRQRLPLRINQMLVCRKQASESC